MWSVQQLLQWASRQTSSRCNYRTYGTNRKQNRRVHYEILSKLESVDKINYAHDSINSWRPSILVHPTDHWSKSCGFYILLRREFLVRIWFNSIEMVHKKSSNSLKIYILNSIKLQVLQPRDYWASVWISHKSKQYFRASYLSWSQQCI